MAEVERPRTSTRDPDEVVRRLRDWLTVQTGSEQAVRISNARGPGTAGFSSETLLFDANWVVLGKQCSGAYVLRLPPPSDAFPSFLTTTSNSK